MIAALALTAPPIDGDFTPSFVNSAAGTAVAAAPYLNTRLVAPHEETPCIEASGMQFAEAARLLEQMTDAGAMTDVANAQAQSVLYYLALWGAPRPTELSDGSGGDFSILWNVGRFAASLSFADDEILGYSFRPGMPAPYLFEGDRIGVSELNKFVRTLR